MQNKPRLAVTMGDPAGVGAEIAVKTFANADIFEYASPFVIGSAEALRVAAAAADLDLDIVAAPTAGDCGSEPGRVTVLEPHVLDLADVTTGQVSAVCGEAAVRYFEASIRLAQSGEIQGVVTCPINKEAVHAAGFHGDIGHQEILARMTGAPLTATLLITEGLKVAHLSTHLSLGDAVRYVRTPILLDKLRLTSDSLEQWCSRKPRIAVSALNPHGGEGGMLGREEIEEIAPAVAAARAEGMDVVGPYPADSVFYRAVGGEFDAVMALYHDQGHIAIKVHNFEDSITATMGIPFVRTSVDHGTAFDIAGKNLANPKSLGVAMRAAIAMMAGRFS